MKKQTPMTVSKSAFAPSRRAATVLLMGAIVVIGCSSTSDSPTTLDTAERAHVSGINDGMPAADAHHRPAPTSRPVTNPSVAIDGMFPPRNGSAVRPALSGDLTAFTREQLLAGGYPMRPPASQPEAYKAWVEQVSKPWTVVDLQLTRLPSRGTTVTPDEVDTDPGWAATLMIGDYDKQFYQIYGQWDVPAVAYHDNIHYMYSSLWVGLDGYGYPYYNDLLQAGTEQDISPSGVTSYFAWYEYLPYDPGQVAVSLAVDAGDSFGLSIYVGDVSGNETPWGSYAWFYFWNATTSSTTGWFKIFYYNSQLYFYGREAEAVYERTYQGYYPWLAPCGTPSISGVFVNEYTYGWGNAPYYANIEMWNGTSELASASPTATIA